MSLAEVENMAALQSFTVGEPGHAPLGNVRFLGVYRRSIIYAYTECMHNAMRPRTAVMLLI